MESKIVAEDKYETEEEFGIDYRVKGVDQTGEPFHAVVSFGFAHDDEQGLWCPTCSVIWNGVLDHNDMGRTVIYDEEMAEGDFHPRVRREMDAMLKEILRLYPEFDDIEEFLGW
jgi:hypothetical protein